MLMLASVFHVSILLIRLLTPFTTKEKMIGVPTEGPAAHAVTHAVTEEPPSKVGVEIPAQRGKITNTPENKPIASRGDGHIVKDSSAIPEMIKSVRYISRLHGQSALMKFNYGGCERV